MLTKLTIRNFKQFDEVEIELGDNVIFIGPNNSGKTTALQALALWQLGVRKWAERLEAPPGVSDSARVVAVGRADLAAVPVPDLQHLFRDLRHAVPNGHGKYVPIEIAVEGASPTGAWACGLAFRYVNDESLECEPLGQAGDVPVAARAIRVSYVAPMSGLTMHEDRLVPGSIAVRGGEGRTAEVLRNLCEDLRDRDPAAWQRVVEAVATLFGVRLQEPRFVAARGEVTMAYLDRSGVRLDLSAAGRGLLQTLHLLVHLERTEHAVLLLDEPDAHLEILRQRQIYDVLTQTARRLGSQIVAASHSEVLLDQAADRDVVVAFVGKPHRIDDRSTRQKSQVLKALKEIGFAEYAQAMQRGWVLYLEGSTDLAILEGLARVLGHPAASVLRTAFVRSIGGNRRSTAQRHFFGLREAKPDLVGVVLLDKDATADEEIPLPLRELRWRRREIESYLAPLPVVLARFAASEAEGDSDPLHRAAGAIALERAMRETIVEQTAPVVLAAPDDVFWRESKLSDEYLPRVFKAFYAKRGLPNLMLKRDYHVLAPHVRKQDIDPEVVEKLDAILEVAKAAEPEGTDPA